MLRVRLQLGRSETEHWTVPKRLLTIYLSHQEREVCLLDWQEAEAVIHQMNIFIFPG